ncbi:MAG: hypothetical protein KatS3mg018_0430 [Fimbriimonadales bacterium]|nr:MAG: hypothetical protein KatS3mg018_0430 [Fimbriimonadales bacterium]
MFNYRGKVLVWLVSRGWQLHTIDLCTSFGEARQILEGVAISLQSTGMRRQVR